MYSAPTLAACFPRSSKTKETYSLFNTYTWYALYMLMYFVILPHILYSLDIIICHYFHFVNKCLLNWI